MPRCMLCGQEHKVITNTHLKYSHGGMTQYEYQKMFPSKELFPVEVRRAMGPEGGSTKSEYTRGLMSKNHAGGMPLGYIYTRDRIVVNKMTDGTKKLISEGNLRYWSEPKNRIAASLRQLGRTLSKEHKRRISEASSRHRHSEETKKRMSESHTGKIFSSLHRRRLSESAQNLWNNPEHAEKQQILMHQGMRKMPWAPSLPEYELGITLEANFPGRWKYNGSGGLVLGKYLPDFVRLDGPSQLIEVFGHYWHSEGDEEKKKSIYKGFGYDCLVFWEDQIWIGNPKVVNSIRKFMEGGN